MNRLLAFRFLASARIAMLVVVCAAGARMAWIGPWRFDIDTDPTGPVVLLLRVCVLGLAGWVGSCTMVALVATLVRSSRAYELAIRLLPGTVRSWVIRSIAQPITGAALAGSLMVPMPGSSVAISVDVNGQQWPSSETSSRLHDPDAPTLIADGTPRSSLTRSTSPAPTSRGAGRQTGTVASPTSAPSIGLSSVPASTAMARGSARGAVRAPAPSTTAASESSSPSSTGPTSTTMPSRSVRSESGHRATSGGYVVRAGDHFWSIAERQLAAVSPNPTEAEVRSYWITLVEANTSKLSDPSNPDLLHIGTVLSIPPVKPPTTPPPTPPSRRSQTR